MSPNPHHNEEPRFWLRWAPFVLSALVLHFVLLGVWALLLNGAAPAERQPAARKVSVTTRKLTREQWERNLKVRPPRRDPARLEAQAPEPPKPEAEKPPEPETKPQGQIVDLARPEREEKPSDSKYLSSYDIKVEKERKARETAPHENVLNTPQRGAPVTQVRPQENPTRTPEREPRPARPKPDELVLREPSPEPAGRRAERRRGTPEPPAEGNRVLLPRESALSRLKLREDEAGTMENQRERVAMRGNADRLDVRLRLEPGTLGTAETTPAPDEGRANDGAGRGADAAPTRRLNLMPDMTTIRQIAGGPSNDHLENVEEGEGTWLNSRAFRYAPFFNRVKREVSLNWQPQRVYQLYDPNFRLHGWQSRRAVIDVVLTKTGDLVSARVARPSGVDFFDEEAVNAIHRAAPFPNPPEGLAEADGMIRFPFGFYFAIAESRFLGPGTGP